MRIACLHLPGFPLQVAARDRAGRPWAAAAPGAAEALPPLAVLGPGPAPRILCCSRRAHEAGVRPGMSPAAARALLPGLEIAPATPVRWREALAALAGDLAALAPALDLDDTGGEPAASASLHLAVPAGVSSQRFARRLLAEAERHGLRARVGVAADRFTAWAAARTASEPVTIVPRGESAAFLAPLPLELLPLHPEVRAILRSAGVRTLGQFAALPPPSVSPRPAGHGPAVDYRALARGEGPTRLRGFAGADRGAPGSGAEASHIDDRRPARPARRGRPARVPAGQLVLAG